jgi:hypothetical protein
VSIGAVNGKGFERNHYRNVRALFGCVVARKIGNDVF